MDGTGMIKVDSVVSLGDMAQTNGSRSDKRQTPLERRSTAWIPSGRAAQVFAQPLPTLDKRLSYTMPGLMQEGALGDPVADLAKKHLTDTNPVVLRPTVERSTESLRRLIVSFYITGQCI